MESHHREAVTAMIGSVASSVAKSVASAVTRGQGAGGGSSTIASITASLLSELVADLEVYTTAAASTPSTDGTDVKGWKSHLGTVASSSSAGTLRTGRLNSKSSIEVAGNTRFIESTNVTSSRALSAAYVWKPTRRQGAVSIQLAGYGTTPFLWVNAASGFYTVFDDVAGDGSDNTDYKTMVQAEYHTAIFSFGPSDTKFRINGLQRNGLPVMSNTGKTSLYTAHALAGNGLRGEILYGAVWDKTLSEAEMATIEADLNSYYSLPIAAGTRLCWWEGDSIAQGIYVTNIADEHQIKANADLASGDRYSVRSSAVQASTTTELTARQSYVNAQADAASSTNKVLNIWVGTNDLVVGKSAATLRSDLITLCNAYRTHFDKIVIWDVLPRVSTTDAVRLGYNALLDADFGSSTAYTRIKTGASYADFLVQIGSDPTLGPFSAVSDAAVYPDGIHPYTVASQVIIADYGTKALTLCL